MLYPRILLCLFLCLSFSFISGQVTIDERVINSGGLTNSRAGINVEFSIGEMSMVHAVDMPAYNFSLGFLQGTPDIKSIEQPFLIKVFPTVVTGKLNITGKIGETTEVHAWIFDAGGRAIKSFKFNTGINRMIVETIDCTFLKKGMYFIRFTCLDNDINVLFKSTTQFIKH